MAKPKTVSDSGAGKVKIRVIEFEIEGNDTTMQESLKSITAALNRGMTSQQPAARQVRYVPAPSAADEDADQVEDSVEADAEVEDAPVSAAPRRAPVAKKVPTPKLLDIRFQDGTPSLKEFMAEKKPTNELQRYLVIAYWFKHSLQTNDLTADHFFTAYRHLGLQVPRDPMAPVRDLRHKRRTQMGQGTTAGTSAINHIGENLVEQMGKDD